MMTTILALATGTTMVMTSPSSEARTVYVPTRIEVGTESLVVSRSAAELSAERRTARDLRERVVTRLGQALRERHVPVGAMFDGAVVRVDLQRKAQRGSHYLVRVAVERGGQPLVVTDALECVSCNGDRLADTLVGQVPALLVRLEDAAGTAAEPASIAGDDEAGSSIEPTAIDESSDRTSRNLGPLAYGGIAALVVGTAGVVGGSVLLARGSQRSLEPDHRLQRVDDYRPAGGALVGIAGLVVATGVVLLIVDRNRRRTRSMSRSLVHPMLGARTAGVEITTRF